ncbi:MAG: SHOCT domain-containing protein [Sporichthyaceae bacterium]
MGLKAPAVRADLELVASRPEGGSVDNVRIDTDGDLRCPKCGGRNLIFRRTGRAKAAGIGAGLLTVGIGGAVAGLAAQKRAYCQGCKTYSLTGNPRRSVAPVDSVTLPGDLFGSMSASQLARRFPHSFATSVDAAQFEEAVPAGEELVHVGDRVYVRYGEANRRLGAPATVAVPFGEIQSVLWLERLCMVRLLLWSDEIVNLDFPIRDREDAEWVQRKIAAAHELAPARVPAPRTELLDDTSPPEVDADADVVGTIARLNDLRLAGALTDEEFAQKKAELLARL